MRPRPPRAPAVAGQWAGVHPKGRKSASWDPGQPQSWFPLPTPMLELVEGRRRHTLRFVAPYPLLCGVGLGVLAGIFLLVNSIRNPDYALSENVLVFSVIIVAVTLGYIGVRYLQQRRHRVYAGSDWIGDGEGRADWVNPNDLARFTVVGAPGPGSTLRLTGRNGVVLSLPLGLLEGNPALWDLVYLGLRRSAAAGAQVDPATRELLRLGVR